MIRAILIACVTFSASLSAAMDAGNMKTAEHHHEAAPSVADDAPVCCDESTEHGNNCHALPAVLAYAGGVIAAPPSSADMLILASLFLTGIEPSGPLDPARRATLPTNHSDTGFARFPEFGAHTYREEVS